MLNKENLFSLAKAIIHANNKTIDANSTYSYNGVELTKEDLNETLRYELNSLAETYSLYRKNKDLIFELIETVIDEALPNRVMQQYQQFAEIKIFKQGDKPIFINRISKSSKHRAMQFITKVGLAGMYEVFKLDNTKYEIPTSAFGGAAQIGFEEFLDGRVDLYELLEIVLLGLDRAIYIEIERALKSTVTNLQRANKKVSPGFVESEMDDLLSVADSYGNGKATIYCTYEFAATMIPSDGWVSNEMKNDMWNNGALGIYKGHKVIVLQQSYEDETNETKVIDPSYAWIIPSGNSKPVKIAIEGQTIVDEFKNYDRSKEIQVYKKVGVAVLGSNNLFVYQNTSLIPDEDETGN